MASKLLPPESEESVVRILLWGRTGVGKSESGNTILRRPCFKTELSGSSLTEKCEMMTKEFNGKTLAVVDTPGLFHTCKNHQELMKAILKCTTLIAPGPHVLLLVLKLGTFRKDDKDMLDHFQKVFPDAKRHTIVLFTHGEPRGEDGKDEKEKGKIEQHDALKKFINESCVAYHVFNNREAEDESQVTGLLEKIDNMILKNGGHYKNELFEGAMKALDEIMQRAENKTFHSDKTLKMSYLSKKEVTSEVPLLPAEQLRIVLVGMVQVGKTSVMNTILRCSEDRETHADRKHTHTQTKECQREEVKIGQQTVVVVDTPGLCHAEIDDEDVMKEIKKCLSHTEPGPHVFLFVLGMERYTEYAQGMVENIKKTFGKGVLCHSMALFTHGDELNRQEQTIEQFIKGNSYLESFVKECKGGCHVIENTDESPSQVTNLLEKINSMVKENEGKYYTTEMYKEAEVRKKISLSVAASSLAGAALGGGLSYFAGGALGATAGTTGGAVVGGAMGAAGIVAMERIKHKRCVMQ
ncbi:GTPase IMAP family member 4-like [Plectropomus leopardus]|uniref:GTPase IMAP family member 4-like n=1 Tax=Plectropomus leopardus TaxID=160734 RepID=UPI001C4DA435|nr:GTPase IMAP family member 4-like [Plectropomus leopardus]